MFQFDWISKYGLNYTGSQKNVPDISECILKKDCQILIIFGTSIPDATDHRITSLNACIMQGLILSYQVVFDFARNCLQDLAISVFYTMVISAE